MRCDLGWVSENEIPDIDDINETQPGLMCTKLQKWTLKIVFFSYQIFEFQIYFLQNQNFGPRRACVRSLKGFLQV